MLQTLALHWKPVLFWALAVAASLLYAFGAFAAFFVSTTGTSLIWRWHQRWFNFVGSLAGWFAFWTLLAGTTGLLGTVLAGAVAFTGITGHLPMVFMVVVLAVSRAAPKAITDGLRKVFGASESNESAARDQDVT
jgi:hypothetical protein